MSEHPSKDEVVQVPCIHADCKSKGTYRVNAGCTNCNWSGVLEITKGHEFSRWTPCPRCACTYTLLRQST